MSQGVTCLSESPATQLSAALTHYPCCDINLLPSPVVLLHGWGADSQIWQTLPYRLSQRADVFTADLPGFGTSPALRGYALADLLAWLDQTLPQRCFLVGLSLGGMLACAFAAAYPQRIAGLITLASNSRFSADTDANTAMPSAQYQQFLTGWQDSSDDCLSRFCALQAQGDTQQRSLLRLLRAMPVVMDESSAGSLLRLLGSIDNRDALSHLASPTLAIFGDRDPLVPVACAQPIGRLNPLIEVAVIDGAGHLPQISQPDRVEALIVEFLQRQQYRLNKEKVAESFGRAAPRYDAAAQLQHRVGEQLVADIDRSIPVERIIDLGCGTGYHCPQLQRAFPAAQVVGVDLSEAMLAHAASSRGAGYWVCADAERLPLADHSQDCIFSNFALQWCTDLTTLAGELYRVLKPFGQLRIVVPGQATLIELRSAWASVDNHVHVNHFASADDWRRVLWIAGFQRVEIRSEKTVEQHQTVRELLLELKTIGAHNNNSGKPTTLTGKQQLKALYTAYERFRTVQDHLPATWEILSLSAYK